MKVIVVGGGPAGMMAALKASEGGHDVILIERNNSLGRKLLLTGNRRCNISNNKDTAELVKLINNGKFLYSNFSRFNVDSIISFFAAENLPLIEEDDNRMYPKTEKARDVLDVLEKKLKESKVTIMTNTFVDSIEVKHQIMVNNTWTADHLIMATGGLSFPSLGSDGSGHQLLEKLDVSSTPFYPCEAPLLSKDPIIKSLDLVGLSLSNIGVSLLNKSNKILYKTEGDLIFTHKGLSGPAILKCCEHAYHCIEKEKKVTLRLQIVRSMNQHDFALHLNNLQNERIDTILNSFMPKRLSDYIIENLNLEKNTKISQISNATLEKLYTLIYRFDIQVNRTDSLSRAFVTGGGIDLKQVNSKTLTLKMHPNISVCGELLDLHGPIGGYNLTIAMLTGMLAGASLTC